MLHIFRSLSSDDIQGSIPMPPIDCLCSYPDFVCNEADWPPLTESTDGYGYCPQPKANPTFSAQYTLSSTFSNIPVNSVAGIQDCNVYTAAQLAAMNSNGTCYWGCSNQATNCVRPSDITTCGTALSMGLTFDDGPTPATLELLKFLVANNIKATFFLVGCHILQYPNIARALLDAGMELGIHTWSHHPLTTQSNDVIIAELLWSMKAFKAVLGYVPTIMRPPLGDIDDRVRGIVAAMGLTPVIWNIDTLDWTTDSAPSTALTVVNNFLTLFNNSTFTNGVIVLHHDYFQAGVKLATGTFIPFYVTKGYTYKLVSTCSNRVMAVPAGSNNVTTVKQPISCNVYHQSSKAINNAAPSIVLSIVVLLAVTAILLR